MIYYFTTTILAVILGIVLVYSIKPGDRTDPPGEVETSETANVTTVDTLLDLARNAFPPNIIQATMNSYRTILIYPGPEPYEAE